MEESIKRGVESGLYRVTTSEDDSLSTSPSYAPLGPPAATAGIVAFIGKRAKLDQNAIGALDSEALLKNLPDVTEWIRTGIPTVDIITGGGFPVGRIIEVYGEEQAGKTAITQAAMACAQQMNAEVMLIDSERSLEKYKLRALDASRLIYLLPPTMEQAIEAMIAFCEYRIKNPRPHPALVVWDSIVQTPTKAEMDRALGDASPVAAQARVLSQNVRVLLALFVKARVAAVWINQQRDTIKQGWGAKFDPKAGEPTTPCGKAIKYVTAIRLHCKMAARRKDKATNNITGMQIESQTYKCKIVSPYRKADWILDFEEGPSPWLTACETLTEFGKITSTGKRDQFVMEGSKRIFTKDEFRDLVANPGFYERVVGTIKALPYTNLVKPYSGSGGSTEEAPEE